MEQVVNHKVILDHVYASEFKFNLEIRDALSGATDKSCFYMTFATCIMDYSAMLGF